MIVVLLPINVYLLLFVPSLRQMYLEELVNSWYRFDNLGDSGSLLMIRYYSIPRGLLHPKAKVKQEIDLWVKSYCKRLVSEI